MGSEQSHQKFKFDKVFLLKVLYSGMIILKRITIDKTFTSETIILERNSHIYEQCKNQKAESKQNIVNVPKLDFKHHVSEIYHEHSLGNQNLSDEELKLKKKIDDIFFNKLFAKQQLDDLENDLEKIDRKDSTNPLFIQGNP